ncbi:MFS transporter [Barrientosiimonas endolithica]
MVILDAQIVVLALPSIQTDLGFATTGDAQWVMSGYLIAFGGLLLLGGRAGDLLGQRQVFLVGTGLFGASSLLCGLAWTPGVLVAARALHGVSAALMAPTALGILLTTFPQGPERNKALAAWGAFGGLGATAALLIGGVVTTGLGWEWLFFLNLPVAAVMLVLSPLLLTGHRPRVRPRVYDPAGALTLTGALVLACLAVVRAPEAGWISGQTLGLLASAVLLGVVFVTVERRSKGPLVPLRIFASRVLVGGNLVMLLVGMTVWGMGLMASQYAQQVLGYTPLLFGLGTAVMTVMAMTASYAAQAALARVRVHMVAAVGTGLLAAGSLLLTGVSPGGSYAANLLPGLFVFGAGLGASTVAASVAGLGGVADHDAGVASGINTAAFQIGGALGAVVVSTIAIAHGAALRGAPATAGLQAGFTTCAILAGAGLLGGLWLLRTPQPAGPSSVLPRTARVRGWHRRSLEAGTRSLDDTDPLPARTPSAPQQSRPTDPGACVTRHHHRERHATAVSDTRGVVPLRPGHDRDLRHRQGGCPGCSSKRCRQTASNHLRTGPVKALLASQAPAQRDAHSPRREKGRLRAFQTNRTEPTWRAARGVLRERPHWSGAAAAPSAVPWPVLSLRPGRGSPSPAAPQRR